MRKDVPFIDKIVGLNCWTTPNRGIRAVLKENLEDFIVEEILQNGSIVSLEKPRLQFSGYEGLFTHFILIKKGIGNFEASWIISRVLKTSPSLIFYSGNKDKDALTVQRAAVWGIPPEKLLAIELPPSIKILSPIRELRRIYVGDHYGNRFTITMRKIPSSDLELLKVTINSINKKETIPNFFGYQRFGIMRPISHYVGKLLLLRKYKEAIISYLSAPGLFDSEDLIDAKQKVREEKFARALRAFPRRNFLFENLILKKLIKTKHDYARVLKQLPHYLLRIFIEAYQSYIFNIMLSRIILQGLPLIENGKIKMLPIIGYATPVHQDPYYQVLEEILDEENMTRSLFKNRKFPPLTSGGSFRRSLMTIKIDNPQILDDEKHPGHKKAILRFSLQKGEYATVVLREILKHNILVAYLSKHLELYRKRLSINLKRLYQFINEIKHMTID